MGLEQTTIRLDFMRLKLFLLSFQKLTGIVQIDI